MALIELLLTFLSLIIIFLRYWLVVKNKNSPIYQWPLLGMLPSLLRSLYKHRIHEFVTQALRRGGGTFLLKGPSFIDADYLVTSDPMNTHHIFSKNVANYDKGRDLKAILDPLGDGIFNADGESWKFQRQLLHSLLSNSEFEGHAMQTLERKMKSTLLPVLDEASRTGDELDVQDVSKRFMFDNICLLVMGFDTQYLSVGSPAGGLLDCPCGEAFEELEEGIVYRHMVPMCVWRLQNRLQIGKERKCIRASRVVDQFLYGNIKRKKQELATKGSYVRINDNNVHEKKKLDLLTQILVAKDRDGGGEKKFDEKSDRFLRDLLLTLVTAGRDTISVSLTWFIWSVANHPAVEKRILEELRQVMATRLPEPDDANGGDEEKSGFLSKGELNKLVYLHATVCETLRLYPPAPFEHKCAKKADVLPSGHTVRRDDRILFSIYSMARLEEIWGKDCMEFKPERWISKKGRIIHVPSFKFMTFVAGPRTCLGKAIAFSLVKSLASAVLWNYKFEVTNGPSVRPAVAMILFMEDGLKTRVSKRVHSE